MSASATLPAPRASLPYFRALLQEASNLSPLEPRTFSIAGNSVQLLHAELQLPALIAPAFAHLATTSGDQPHLTIHLCRPDQLPSYGSDPFFAEDDGRAHRHRLITDTFFVFSRSDTESIAILDLERGKALYCTSASSLPDYERAAPLRDLLHVWLAKRDQHVLHAGAVGNENGAALLVGASGSGKSTATLSCLASDLFYFGDDYAVVSRTPNPQVHSLFASAKLKDDGWKHFPKVAARATPIVPSSSPKTMVSLGPLFWQQMPPSAALRYILVPRIVNRTESRITPLSAARALLAIAPSTILQAPAGGAASLDFMKQLLQEVPAAMLESGTDRSQIAECIDHHLRTACG